MSTLAVAIDRQQWETVALCLLLGIRRAAMALPPEAIEEVMGVLAEGPERAPYPKQAGRKSGPSR